MLTETFQLLLNIWLFYLPIKNNFQQKFVNDLNFNQCWKYTLVYNQSNCLFFFVLMISRIILKRNSFCMWYDSLSDLTNIATLHPSQKVINRKDKFSFIYTSSIWYFNLYTKILSLTKFRKKIHLKLYFPSVDSLKYLFFAFEASNGLKLFGFVCVYFENILVISETNTFLHKVWVLTVRTLLLSSFFALHFP